MEENLPFSSFVKTAMDHIKNTGKATLGVLYERNLPFSYYLKIAMDHIKNIGKTTSDPIEVLTSNTFILSKYVGSIPKLSPYSHFN